MLWFGKSCPHKLQVSNRPAALQIGAKIFNHVLRDYEQPPKNCNNSKCYLGLKDVQNRFLIGLVHSSVRTDDMIKNLAWGQYFSRLPGAHTFRVKGEMTRSFQLQQKFTDSKDFSHRFEIYPKSWLLPEQMDDFKKERVIGKFYLSKPRGGSKGRGIVVSDDDAKLKLNESVIIQDYEADVLTYKNHKVDMRVWALVTSVDPLIGYIYYPGYVKVASQAYQQPTTLNADRKDMHLTNLAQNGGATNKAYKTADGIEGVIDLSKFLKEMDTKPASFNFDQSFQTKIPTGYRRLYFKAKISELIEKAFVAVYPEFLSDARKTGANLHQYPKTQFQIFGFDVFITQAGKVKMFEINGNPNLALNQQTVVTHKHKVVRDALNLLGVRFVTEGGKILSPTYGKSDNSFPHMLTKPQYSMTKETLAGKRSIGLGGISTFEKKAYMQLKDESQRLGGFQRLKFEKYLSDFRDNSYLTNLIYKIEK